MLGTGNGMCLQVMLEGQDMLGFVITWNISGWCFIEHFAIAADQRGKNMGSRVITQLSNNHKILLEVEPPESQDAIRRISFYERAGFNLLPVPYQQPSYIHSHISYPMRLMSNKLMVHAEDGQQLQLVIAELNLRVYEHPRNI